MNPLLIRVGVVVLIVVLGGIGSALSGKSSGDLTYWKAATAYDRKVGRGVLKDLPNMRAQFAQLPISGVSDPKLREFHGLMLEVMDDYLKSDGSDADRARIEKKANRLDALITDLNRKYAGR
ncbi:MAG: hypothetical protein KIS92_05805 [Planctomycetota bacterium]|nr:hypothetical protein [Planctomycetota bacterium]